MEMGAEADVKDSIPKFKDSAAMRRVLARDIDADAETQMGPASSYHGLFRALYEAGRMRGNSEALDAIASQVERIPPGTYQVEHPDELR